jgi:hypothetical protein
MERSRFAIPAVPSDALARPSLAAWFDAYARVPLRYVVGQPGAGKTTAVAMWAQQQSQDVAWLSLRSGATDGDVFALLTDVLAHSETPQRTIVVDDLDRAAPSARTLLAELYLHAAQSVQFIYVARAFTAVDVSEGEQRGVTAVADGPRLRFGTEDIALFSELLGVAFNQRDCARLETATDGWALAVTGAVRAAKAAGVALREGLEHWRIAHGRSVERIVADALKAAPARDAQDLLDILDGRAEPAPATLRRLARAGLFVDTIEGRYAINPVVADGRVARTEPAPQSGPLVLEMFGRFRVMHEGREVRFVRRRDAQIVQYLALQPQGRATRAELVRTFWPDADPQLGAQGLRTACSAIRRAMAARVGAAAVDRYLFSGPAQIGLRFDAVVSSTHRFALHADLAVAAEARGAAAVAYRHWSAALQLYTAPVLSGEPFAWWIEQRAATFEILRARGRQFVREASVADALT